MFNHTYTKTNTMRTIRHIFVHCTATPGHTTVAALQAAFKQRGWTAPGYHYVIRADGHIVKLLDELFTANGVAGYNLHAIHVAYIGGIDADGRPIDNRTAAQKASLLTLLRLLRSKYPAARILGHRDISPDKDGDGRIAPWERIKACPCFDAQEEYRHLLPLASTCA